MLLGADNNKVCSITIFYWTIVQKLLGKYGDEET